MRSDRFAFLSLVVPFLTLAASELARAHGLLRGERRVRPRFETGGLPSLYGRTVRPCFRIE